jgi:hypothetical protein
MKKIKMYFINKYGLSLDRKDLIGYRNLLKIIYHKHAEHPILDINKDNSIKRYFIDVPSLKMTLIIDDSFAEIINSNKIWPLNLNKYVYERAIQRIHDLKSKQIQEKEDQIKSKKQSIIEGLYSQIK